jgi:hypothetical protein
MIGRLLFLLAGPLVLLVLPVLLLAGVDGG